MSLIWFFWFSYTWNQPIVLGFSKDDYNPIKDLEERNQTLLNLVTEKDSKIRRLQYIIDIQKARILELEKHLIKLPQSMVSPHLLQIYITDCRFQTYINLQLLTTQVVSSLLLRSLQNKTREALEKLSEEYFKKEELPNLPSGMSLELSD